MTAAILVTPHSKTIDFYLKKGTKWRKKDSTMIKKNMLHSVEGAHLVMEL